MVFEIDFSDVAQLDLQEARTYYASISKNLLMKFDNSIIESVGRLEKAPQNFQKRYRNINIVFTKTFPYCIHYLIDNRTVFIQRILHQKQFYE